LLVNEQYRQSRRLNIGRGKLAASIAQDAARLGAAKRALGDKRLSQFEMDGGTGSRLLLVPDTSEGVCLLLGQGCVDARQL
jgi:hypothetical protein